MACGPVVGSLCDLRLTRRLRKTNPEAQSGLIYATQDLALLSPGT